MPQVGNSGSTIPKKRAKAYVSRAAKGPNTKPTPAARSYTTISSKTPGAKAGVRAALVNKGQQGARKRAARATVRKVTRQAVRKGISGPTEDSLGITRQEGGRKIRRAVKVLGQEKATKVAAKTRMRQGQTYKGKPGWVSKAKPVKPGTVRRKYGNK